MGATWRSGLVSLTLLAFALRLHALASVPLRWDEGWSIAMATIPWREMVWLTALDVHPPLYYACLALWLRLAGLNEFTLRALSAFASTAAVPLVAATAAVWWAGFRQLGRTVALAAALLIALAPPLVYYAGVGRMYGLTAPLVLGLAWAVGRLTLTARRPLAMLLVASAMAAAALYAFYYSAFALAGVWLAGLTRRPRAWGRLLAGAAPAAMAYIPWLVLAAQPMLQRTASRVGGAPDPLQVLRHLGDGFCGLLLCQADGRWLALALGVLAATSLLLRTPGRRSLGLSLWPVFLVLAGASIGAEAHMLAPRYVIVATPFLLLGLAWASVVLWQRWRMAGMLAFGLLGAALLPPLAGYVYARTAEVSDPYDPSAVWRQLAPHAVADDVVAFNILSLAGAYELYRRPEDARWTYAQLWDPVHEPVSAAEGRLTSQLPPGRRLWLVLYRGLASPDSGELKSRLDRTFYPASGWWHEDIWYQSYINAVTEEVDVGPIGLSKEVRLDRAALSRCVRAGQGIGVELAWRALATPTTRARVFVHAYDAQGQLVAQHDAYPAADTRPPDSWRPGETIVDRHGLWIPPLTTGELVIKVGLYDPETGSRWLLADATDSLELGRVTVIGADGGDPGRCP